MMSTRTDRSEYRHIALSATVHALVIAAIAFAAASAGMTPRAREVLWLDLSTALEAGGAPVGPAPASSEPRTPPAQPPAFVRAEPEPVAAPKPEAVSADATAHALPEPEAPPMRAEPEALAGARSATAASTVSTALGAPGLSALIGSGHGAGAGRAAEVVAIREDIRKSLQGSVVYPPMARRFGMEGTVVAGFELQSDGTPTAIAVRESSGYEILDTTVLALIRRVSPFPAPGVRVPDVRIPVTFRLIPD